MGASVKLLLIAATLAASACASAPAATIDDKSFTDAQGLRAIQLSVWLNAPPSDVYRSIATVEGWKTWAVESAFGEVKIGGVMETSYNANAKAGDPANIKQEFLALVPDRLVVFRTIQTPPGFPHPELYMKTVAVMQLQPEAGGARLTFTHEGFGAEPGFSDLYDFFLKGDTETMESLRKLFSAR